MKRTIPLLITALGGLVLIVSFFVPARQANGETVAVWFDILASIAFILGGANLFKVHLKAMSDRIPGWGYSAVTLISFTVMLLFGLLKTGTAPAPSTEYYGESFVHLPVSALPVFSVTGQIPQRTDGEALPSSVSRQMRQAGDQIEFQGWLEANQVDDLLQHDATEAWRCAVEKLAAQAIPPAPLQGKVRYLIDHSALAFRGQMTSDDEQVLAGLLRAPESRPAVETLAQQARRRVAVPVLTVPRQFAVPPAHSATVAVTQSGDQRLLEIQGPMSVSLREQMADAWAGWDHPRPLDGPARVRLQAEIEALGGKLSELQIAALDRFVVAQASPGQLVQALNQAGAAREVEKSHCECLAEMTAGVSEISLTSKSGTDLVLNAEQRRIIDELFYTATPADLVARLRTAGPLTEGQAEAASSFLTSQPTVGQRNHDLCFELLKEGPLSAAQREYLLKDFAAEAAWRRTVGRLFAAAHAVKYPWSGAYDDPSSPFGWLYEYVMLPLMTTMFALLAFYVASAAFRAFRAKNVDAILLLGTAFIILLRATPLGAILSGLLPESLGFLKLDNLYRIIMSVFNTAGNRAIMIGIALGIASTSLKVLLGIDRSYLGADD